MKKVGFVGWRGMVGSVLLERMSAEGDFQLPFTACFFTTSQQGSAAPLITDNQHTMLMDANNPDALADMDIIISCQGGDYTSSIHPQLRSKGWNGYWIDASSSLRMADNSIIVLDPLNKDHIVSGIGNGIKDYIGGNCTVSLMLLAIHGLLKENLVEWVSAMTYQAISGAGAGAMREMMQQMKYVCDNVDIEQPSVLQLERAVKQQISSEQLPKKLIGYPLAMSLLPWIDSEMPNGQSREEWKGQVEANKLLNLPPETIKIDGVCVRISSLRCHSQGLVLGLKKDISPQYMGKVLSEANDWVKVIPNTKSDTLNQLTPTAVTGTLDIAIGRIRSMNMAGNIYSAYTVGDQLLWGAAEPLRRILTILFEQNV